LKHLLLLLPGTQNFSSDIILLLYLPKKFK
jgi:hypothetical protein